MFDKMKQLYELQKQAREMQKKLESISVEEESGGIKIKMNGLMKVEGLEIDPSYLAPDRKEKLETSLSRLFNDAVQSSQKRSASFSQDLLKGLSLPG